ncbi:MAG TPA: S41 family peptidase [Saprospiraceae bacterium]|nr:S41 family peptidase [Saprospiraceae bacterium]HNT20579.1 S41 family peptidase [Saprospiraceae bacterium]
MPDKGNPKKYEIAQPLLLACTVVLGMLLGRKMEQSNQPEQKNIPRPNTATRVHSGLIDEAVRYIDARYIDSVGTGHLTDLAIESMLENLDPFSVYLPAGTVPKDSIESFEEAYGFSPEYVRNQWVIGSPDRKFGSLQNGLAAGDQIVSVSNKPPDRDIWLNWKADSLHLRVRKPETREIKEVLVRRASGVPIIPRSMALALNARLAYIRIPHFGDQAYDEFITAVDSFYNKHKIRHYVIDLRGNSGGYLEECSRILNQLFKENNLLLVSTKGRTVRQTEYKTDGRQLFDLGQVVVLIDGGSASASEAFAGAVQDLKRGRVVGQASYGKGLVQEQYMLSNGSALRLSVARFYLPSGRTLDHEGKYEPSFEELKAVQGKKQLVHRSIIPDVRVARDTTMELPAWLNLKKLVRVLALESLLDLREGRKASEPEARIFRTLNTNSAPLVRNLVRSNPSLVKTMIRQEWLAANMQFTQAEKEDLLAQKEIQTAVQLIRN